MVKQSLVSALVCLLSIAAQSKLIDSHVHLSSPKHFPEEAMSSDGLIQLMNQAGVEKAFVLSSGYSVSDQRTAEYENDYVSAEISKYPGRLFGFCGVNPLLNWSNDEVDRCQRLGNFVGLKIHTNTSRMELSNEAHLVRLATILKQANDFGWTVLIHSGQWSVKDLMNFIYLTSEFPKVKFILGHGLFEGYRNLILFAAARRESPDFGKNVFLEISGLIHVYANSPEAPNLLWHLRMFGIDRVLFGSDFPVFSFSETYDSLKRLGATDEEIEKISYGNYQAFSFLRNEPRTQRFQRSLKAPRP